MIILCSLKAGEMVVLRVSCSDNDVAKGYVVCDEVSGHDDVGLG